MPKIPDASALGVRPTPESSRPVSGYRGGIAEGAAADEGLAVARVGQQATAVGEKILDTQDRLAYGNAQQQFLAAKLEADRAALDDPDYVGAPQRYQERLQKAVADVGGSIRSPLLRSEFQSSTARLINFGADSVIRQAHAKSVDAGRGNTIDAINAGIDQALSAADEPTRTVALQAIHDRIDAAENAGWFKSYEAASLRKKVPEQFAERRAKMLIDLDPASAFPQLAPPGLEAAPGLATKRPTSVQIPETAALAFANNNPGNLRFANQPGAVAGDGGFAKFATPEDGFAALQNQVALDTSRGLTLGDFITKYAPPKENNTGQYIAQASQALGVDASTPLSAVPSDKLVSFIAQKESGAKVITDDVTPASALSGGAPAARDVVFPKTGDWRDFLDPAKRMDLARQARVRADQIAAANEVNATRQQRLEEKAQRDRAEAAANAVVTQLIEDPSKVDPVQHIANNPDLPANEKWSLFKMTKAAVADPNGKDAKTYGAGFYDFYQRVHAADGDPNRITDPAQLYGHVGPQPTPPPNFPLTNAPGMVKPGNLDPWNRPVLQNPDGSYSTTSSMSIGVEGGEVLIPTVVDGKRLAPDEAIAHFRQTGENFGTFGTPEAADDYATKLHNAQASLYDDHGNRLTRPGDLTVAGVDKLVAEIRGRRTPEGEAEAEMKKTFLANARSQITGTNEGLHLRDPKGDELYLKFLASVLPAYDAGRKAGKSAADLLNPDSKDYIGASIKTFKRPMSQWTKDLMQDNAPGGGAEAGVDLSTPQGLVAAYRANRITREQAEQEALSRGFIRPGAAGPSVPMGQ